MTHGAGLYPLFLACGIGYESNLVHEGGVEGLARPKNGIYGFCVILSEQPLTFGKVKMETSTSLIHTIHYKDSAMVVGKSPYILPPKRENVFAHQKVISEVMESFTVLPLSFGNVFRSEQDVLVLLEKLYEQIHELIPRLKNKVEMGLKLYGKKEWFEKEIESDREIAAIKQKLGTVSSEAAYYERIKGGELAKHFFFRLQQQVIDGIYSPLSAAAESAKLNEPVGDRTLLNAAFLIDKDTESAFDNQVFALHEQWKDKMDFIYNGPWPAYNFVNIRLTVE